MTEDSKKRPYLREGLSHPINTNRECGKTHASTLAQKITRAGEDGTYELSNGIPKVE